MNEFAEEAKPDSDAEPAGEDQPGESASQSAKEARGGQSTTISTGGGAYIGGSVSTGSGEFVGRDKTVYAGGASAKEIAEAFAVLTQKVEKLPEGPDKSIAESAVDGLEKEAQKGEEAKEENVRKWFDFLAQAAPDIFDVAVATFINPIHGLGTAFRKIAEKAKEGKSG